MIRNLFLTAIRNLQKNKFFTLLNVSGLAIGMCVFLLIAQYVRFEKSYEDFIPDNKNIYRVTLERYESNERTLASAENYPGVGPVLKNEIPGVESYARLYNLGYKNNVVITYEGAKPEPIAFKQEKFLYADSSFLPMMNYEMVNGNAATALAEPNTAVLSEKTAKMYFKNEDPIGKTLHLQDDDFNNELVKVTGVFRDLPSNTHLKFDVLFSYKTLFAKGSWAPNRYDKSWSRQDMYTFVQLKKGIDAKNVESKLAAIVDKYEPQLKGTATKDVLHLQPLTDIHLKSDLSEEPEPNGNDQAVFFLGMIGLFVLVIAWINYVNLSTARALERAKEVGIRKVVGAFKRQLIIQFMTEAALVNLISLVLSLGLAIASLKYFNTLSGLQLMSLIYFSPGLFFYWFYCGSAELSFRDFIRRWYFPLSNRLRY